MGVRSTTSAERVGELERAGLRGVEGVVQIQPFSMTRSMVESVSTPETVIACADNNARPHRDHTATAFGDVYDAGEAHG
jgi:hypothetical protein